MYILCPLFAYGRLMPAMLMSGLRIEIQWEDAARAVYGLTSGSGTNGNPNGGVDNNTPFVPADAGYTLALDLSQPVTEAIASYEITNPYFVLASVQLSDSIQRALNELSATNGLEIVYCDWEQTPQQNGTSLLNVNLEIRKSCSRALKAFARIRAVGGVGTNAIYPDGQRDSFRAEAGFTLKEYQWQLGSLYFPQQPVKGGVENDPDMCGVETYCHLLDACDKFHGTARQPYMTFRGDIDTREPKNRLSERAKVSAYYEDVEQGQWFSNAQGVRGSFMNDAHTIGVTLERSTMFNLAGVPVNNSRVLALRATLSDEHSKELNPVLQAKTKIDSSPIRQVDVFLKYVKLARVFLNNVEVEQ